MALPDGVPNLLEGAADFVETAIALLADSFLGYGLGSTPQWGLFLGGVPVVVADTVTAMGYKQNWAVSDYPVERGGFESYDKVNTPYRIQLQFVAGGSEAARAALLDSIAAIGDSLTKYDVLTPEAVYVSVNVDGYSYRRTATNGLGLMIVDVDVVEIREDTSGGFQNTASPSGALPTDVGSVQSTTTEISIRKLQ